jgi:hypothetical protein
VSAEDINEDGPSQPIGPIFLVVFPRGTLKNSQNPNQKDANFSTTDGGSMKSSGIDGPTAGSFPNYCPCRKLGTLLVGKTPIVLCGFILVPFHNFACGRASRNVVL